MPGSEEWSVLEQQFEVGLLDEPRLVLGFPPTAAGFIPFPLHKKKSFKSRPQLSISLDSCIYS